MYTPTDGSPLRLCEVTETVLAGKRVLGAISEEVRTGATMGKRYYLWLTQPSSWQPHQCDGCAALLVHPCNTLTAMHEMKGACRRAPLGQCRSLLCASADAAQRTPHVGFEYLAKWFVTIVAPLLGVQVAASSFKYALRESESCEARKAKEEEEESKV